MPESRHLVPLLLVGVSLSSATALPSDDSMFVADFAGSSAAQDGIAGWTVMTGDGEARARLSLVNGNARVDVDATDDRRNIWWALIRHRVAPPIDVAELARADRELRIDARVRTDTAPRRINLHANHSRTTDFHSHLFEFDLPTAGEWHDIRMTTTDFDARPGDEVFVQLAMMDWGHGKYVLEIERLEVRAVDPASGAPERGMPLPYRPAPAAPDDFGQRIAATAAATVDRAWPDIAFPDWRQAGDPAAGRLLAVSSTQIALLRWDLADFANRTPTGWGLLTLETDAVFRAETGLEEFGELRVAELLPGSTFGDEDGATYAGFLNGTTLDRAINEQTMIDVSPAARRGATTSIPVSPPVLGRLLSGETPGLAIQAQGAIVATFRADGNGRPTLYFNAR